MSSAADYGLISTDDHVIEPPDVWEGRLRSRFQERAPRVVSDEGADKWVFEGLTIANVGLSVMAGKAVEDYSPKAASYSEMRPGCYDPSERLADMDRDGVEIEILYPTVPGMAGSTFIQLDDKDYALACLRAYNDWLADTWCATDPARLIGQVILPLWDIDLAVSEFERGMGLGHKALSFPNAPETLNLPGIADPHWEPLWDAAEAADVPITMHIASGAMRGDLPLDPAAGAPAEVFITVAPTSNFTMLATLLFSGILARHPNLRFVSAEGGIGWLAYLLQRADETWRKHRHWTGGTLKEPPGYYFRRQVFANFLDDAVGLESRYAVGVDNLMFESDYPHSDTTFPRSREIVAERFADVPGEEIRKMVRSNAVRVFGLETTR
jgi:predicted TIM-barrel fold metal-dependent hydrolase